ncbi:hypothetical protein CEXT_690311 [Caerostris extrusa]|uniref:Uncharacterized protein n=1 Tax=Caerostris extrusa TaxID=172846 RepID=A0AAV4W3F8_CAEEX|nr:hypothetical protein CEXT_690311 [Caerostris extrusa]
MPLVVFCKKLRFSENIFQPVTTISDGKFVTFRPTADTSFRNLWNLTWTPSRKLNTTDLKTRMPDHHNEQNNLGDHHHGNYDVRKVRSQQQC